MARRTYHQDQMEKLRKAEEAAEREYRREKTRATKRKTARITQQNNQK